MADGITARRQLSSFGLRPSTLQCITAISLDLPERGHRGLHCKFGSFWNLAAPAAPLFCVGSKVASLQRIEKVLDTLEIIVPIRCGFAKTRRILIRGRLLRRRAISAEQADFNARIRYLRLLRKCHGSRKSEFLAGLYNSPV